MPSLVVPFRGSEGKSRLGPLPAHARAHAGGGDARRRPRGLRRGRADVRRRASGDGRAAGATVRRRPGRRPGSSRARSDSTQPSLATGGDGPYLVVNADLPCVTPRDLLTLAGAVPDARARARAGQPTGRRTRSALASADLFAPLYGPGSAARFAALGPVARRSTRRISSMTSTRSPISSGSAPGSARAPGACSPSLRARGGRMKVTVLSGGVGGARFLRGVLSVVEPDNVSIIGNVGDDVEVLGLHVSPGPRQHPLRPRRRVRRGARLGTRRRDLERARDRGRARRRRLVPARRPRHRSPSRPHAAAAHRPAAVCGDGAARCRVRARAARSCRRPTTRCARSSRRRTGRSRSRTWFVARGHRDEVDARALHRQRPTRGPRRACSRRSTGPT